MHRPAGSLPPEAARSVRRILVTRLRYLGDIVLSTPLLSALREACPQARLEYLCLELHAKVLRGHPAVDVVHTLSDRAGMAETLRLVRELRSPRIDWWIDLFGNPRSAMLCWLSRPRISVGPDRGLRARVFDHPMGPDPGDPSAVAHHLHKLRPLLGQVDEARVEIVVSDAEREEARRRFSIDPTAPPVLLHPGSTWPSKAWPEAKWSALVDSMAEKGLGDAWILSAPGEGERAQRIARAATAPARVLETLPLRTLLALIAEARAYVGNDGGILHCAIALGTPTVGIFGPTEAEIWFPHAKWEGARLAQEFVPCRPCHLHQCDHLSCLVGLPVSRVLRLLEEVVDGTAGGRAHD